MLIVARLDLRLQEPQDVLRLCGEQALYEGEIVDGSGIRICGGVYDALCDLRCGHAPGGQVFHERPVQSRLSREAVDALCASSVQPSFDVLDYHADVAARALDGDEPFRGLDADWVVVWGCRFRWRRPPGCAQLPEWFRRSLHVEDVCDPPAQEALPRFPLLVRGDRCRRRRVHLVVARWKRRGHASDRHCAVFQADRHEPTEDRGQKIGRLDVHAKPIRPYLVRVGHDVLEDARLEVPTRCVQSRRVGAERVEHFLHLVRCRQGLDERNGADYPFIGKAEAIPAEVEEILPKAGLLGGLHLWQIEVQPLSARHLRPSGVEDRQGRAEYCGGHGLPVYRHFRLVELQPPLAVHEEGQRPLFDGVVPSAGLVVVLQRSLHCGQPVAGGSHRVDETVTGRVFIVVQVPDRAFSIGAGVQGVDEHVRNRRGPGDLDSRLLEVVRYWRRPPIRRGGLGGG